MRGKHRTKSVAATLPIRAHDADGRHLTSRPSVPYLRCPRLLVETHIRSLCIPHPDQWSEFSARRNGSSGPSVRWNPLREWCGLNRRAATRAFANTPRLAKTTGRVGRDGRRMLGHSPTGRWQCPLGMRRRATGSVPCGAQLSIRDERAVSVRLGGRRDGSQPEALTAFELVRESII